MYIYKVTSKYFSTVGFKLLGVGLAVMALIALFLWICNSTYLHLPSYVPILISLLPLLLFNLYLLKSWFQHKSRIIMRLARCKYSRFCSIYLYYDNSPKKSKHIDVREIAGKIRPCDILLRRYNHYLDGLIFSQNSYFTHAGIFYGSYNGKELQVIHATGEHGVHFCNLEDFCKCDDVAILRFTTDESEEDVETYNDIIHFNQTTIKQNEVINKELKIFGDLMKDIKHISTNESSSGENYKSIILERAESLKGTGYDAEFNFKNFDTLSCTEFVWYCFKCLFPLHRIRVEDFEYFGFLKMPVITADVFIKNDFFAFVYSSIPSAQNKRDLSQHVLSAHTKLIYFFLNILCWEAAILIACYYIKPVILHAWPIFKSHIL